MHQYTQESHQKKSLEVYKKGKVANHHLESLLRWWYTPAIMTFFLVKYLAKGAGTEAKVGSYQLALASVGSSKEKGQR